MSEHLKKGGSKKESTMIEDFFNQNVKFTEVLDPEQTEVIGKINKVIEVLDLGKDKKGFASWDIESLISAKEKLSRYSEYLGEWISYHETHSDFAYIWRKGKMASDWQPMKEKLAKGLKNAKLTNVEVENELSQKYIEEQYYSMFHRRRADYLILLLATSDKMIRSIDSRLREIERQWKLNQDQHAKNPN